MSTTDIKAPLHSKAWFEENFKNACPVPAQLREISEQVCLTFNILGICDPMYIANKIAFVFKVGDGMSNFTGEILPKDEQVTSDCLKGLAFAFGCNIPKDSEDLRYIVVNSIDRHQAAAVKSAMATHKSPKP
jgi:hypothetical protein